jgi:hypothetical protein
MCGMSALGGTVKATRAELTAALEQAQAELAAANSLLAAIAELAVLPRPVIPPDFGAWEKAERVFAEAQRDRAISVGVAASVPAADYAIAEKVLRDYAAGKLGYEPKLPA